jgi:CBS domain-containing protein
MPRVTFGNDWIRHGVVEIFREDIARFRVLLSAERDEPPAAVLAAGGVPKLSALRLHSGTIYRWNRACYGISDNGQPHLRIEHRALPAGPTVRDEVANAAFFYGLVAHLRRAHGDVARVMRFDAAKTSFFAAAREGLNAQLAWIDGTPRPAAQLILDELLPAARRALVDDGFDADEARGYLDVIEARVRSGQTGAAWALRSIEAMGDCDAAARDRALTEAMLERQRCGEPVHTWPLATRPSAPRYDTVSELMARDLFTVGPDDLAELAVRVMQWQRIRHVPVEDAQGQLVGMVTPKSVLALVSGDGSARAVRDIMEAHPIAVTPETATDAALQLMRDADTDCLPVVDGDKLVGLVTERDFVRALARRR